MKCPKCNYDIDEKMLVCPNCKKVLKLVCPKCETVNKTNTCKKCGFVIVTKCHNCGKVNQTISKTCSKCGFSTYTSVAINSSNIDEFACITMEFPNLDDIKLALGSTKLADKFKTNLDKLIFNYTHSLGVTREIIENIYIIRFNKDASFAASAKSAVNAAIQIQNLITDLNFKLNKLANSSLICKIAILKRDIYSQPSHYKSGFDIKLIYQHKKDLKLLNNLQVITDFYVYEKISNNFDLSALTAKLIKNEMMTFFELNLKKYIKIPDANKEKEEEKNLAKLNIFDDIIPDESEYDDELYDVDAISFNELKCTFTKAKSINLIPEILENFQKNRKKIISIKGNKEFFPQTGEIIRQLSRSNLFSNIFKVTCYDEMKYKPYGFLHELISAMYNFSLSPKNFENNQFEVFSEVDPSGFIKDLINLTERKFPHPEDVRYSLFDLIFNMIYSMSKSLIYIENFEKIDDTSHEVLQLLFEKFPELDISFLVTADKDFSMHKKSHFLLANPNYIEIITKPTPFKELIEKHINKYENILDSYYMRKIAQNTKGSPLYFNNSIDYLMEKELLSLKKDGFAISKFENILIPVTLDELITKRLKHLSKDKEAFNLFGLLLLLGPMVDLLTINLLGCNEPKALEKLIEKNYIYIYNNAVYIQNYNLFKANFLSSTPLELKQEFAKELLAEIFSTEIKHPCETALYKILEQEKQEFIAWEKLARLNASMGDFSAYLNCSVKFLKLLDKYVNESSQKTIEEYKMEVYENISNLVYKYTPNEIHNISQMILSNLEKTTDDKKIIDLCNKMLQGCFIGGNYSYALDLIHKTLSRFANASLNPDADNFNIAFFLISLVKIEIMFSIGNLKDCVEAGDDILNVITIQNLEKLKPENLSINQFEGVVFDAMSFVAISRIILLKDDLGTFVEKVQTNMGKLPNVFDLFLILQKIIRGEKVDMPAEILIEDDKFSKITLNFIRAFNECENDYPKFADYVYQAKISAKKQQLAQIELICDLLIGYSYFKLRNEKKAASIYYNVLDTSIKNGLKMITYLDWYLISVLKFEQREIEVAFGIANNAVVQLEKDYNSSDFMFFLFRILLAKLFVAQNKKESVELCLNNAKFIREKYNLNYDTGELS